MSAPLSIVGDGHVLATDVRRARTAWQRIRGLLGRPRLEPGQSLVIEPAKQVHTFGLGYPIDVVFCDRSGVVLQVVRGMRPRRISPWVKEARFAIELRAGAVPTTLSPGDRLSIEA